MPGRRTGDQLRLPDLSISGFRGIADLQIGRLDRVTLLTGRNGVGKTTVLDAVRVFASRGGSEELSDILMSRGEHSLVTEGEGDRIAVPDVSARFFGRRVAGDGISIGSRGLRDIVDIREIAPTDQRMSPRAAPRDVDPDSAIDCVSLGPAPLANAEIARLWNAIALTDEEKRVVETLRLVLGGGVERVAMVGEYHGGRGDGRSAMVRLRGERRPVPLKSLGDGAVRMLGVALGLANGAGGFLLMEEAGNGIHHSAQRQFWRMVLETAHRNDVQVLATTHSWDSVRGFAQAASELDDIGGALVRIEKKNDDMWAVEYSEDELRVVAEQGIEVR